MIKTTGANKLSRGHPSSRIYGFGFCHVPLHLMDTYIVVGIVSIYDPDHQRASMAHIHNTALLSYTYALTTNRRHKFQPHQYMESAAY
jgi:hypothetical protein